MKYYLKICLFVVHTLIAWSAVAQAPENAADICPLLIGETIPSATLVDAYGNQVSLQERIQQKPTILVFYRGGWCPYCNKQLSGLAEIEREIMDLGYQILAISPDDYRNLKSTEEKGQFNYTLLSDPGGIFIQQTGIAFKTSAALKGFIGSKGQQGEISEIMPVPTVMVLDVQGKIRFEYLNPNYKERMPAAMLLAVLKTL